MNQGGLFARDVTAGRGLQFDARITTCPCRSFVNGTLHDGGQLRPVARNAHDDLIGVQRVGQGDRSINHEMRIRREQDPIFH